MSRISLMKLDDDIDQEIGDDECEDTRTSSLSSAIEEDDLDHHLEVLLPGQVCWDKLL
jgi:hypothetical protein